MLEAIGKGKTLELATADALRQLGVKREEAEIDPLSAGTKGFLGIGGKPAMVRAVIRDDNRVKVNAFMRKLLEHTGINTNLSVTEEGDEVIITLGEEASPLIGHHGQTLDAMQYLISRVLNGDKEDWKKVVLDIDNYREKRDANLLDMALKLAAKVVQTQKDAKTQPLSGAERRVIHMALKENTEITTFSIGSGDKKRVVIALNNRENGRSSSSDERRPQRGGRGQSGERSSDRSGSRSGGEGGNRGGNRGGTRGGQRSSGGGSGSKGGYKGSRRPRPSSPASKSE